MFKKCIVILCLALLVGCSSKRSNPYSMVDNYNLPEKMKYKIGAVNVTLKKKYDNEKYPNQSDLKTLFASKIKAELIKKGLFSEDSNYTLNFDIEYRRIFMGEAFGFKSKFGGSRFTLKSSILTDNSKIGTYESVELVATHGFKVFWRLAKMYTGFTGPEEELEDIDVYVKFAVKRVPE